MAKAKNDLSGKHVVVTTAHRGVFFGKLLERNDGEVTLTDARVCVYWSPATHGFVGLANKGPQAGSKISPGAPKMVLPNVTCILECTAEAIKQWEKEIWG